MRTFIATIRIKGQLVRTTVTADDAIHAKLLLQFLFGINSIAVAPAIAENSADELPDAEQLYLGMAGSSLSHLPRRDHQNRPSLMR